MMRIDIHMIAATRKSGLSLQLATRGLAMTALLAIAPAQVTAQAGGNPWNPYRGQTASVPPAVQQAPLVAPSVQPRSLPAAPSLYAPAGLEQQLATGLYTQPSSQPAPAPAPTQVPTAQPPVTAPGYGAAPTGGGYPAPGYAAPGYAAPAPGLAPGGYPQMNAGPNSYAPYPQTGGFGPGFGGAPLGYGGAYPGYGSYSPGYPLGFPGGVNGFTPFPGYSSNGGMPGFNFSPFGFF